MTNNWGDDFLSCLPFKNSVLLEKIKEKGELKKLSPMEYIVIQGERVNALPLILNGLVRLDFTTTEKDFLLLYLIGGEACTFSYSHLNEEKTALFSAMTLTEVDVLLLPLFSVKELIMEHPEFCSFILEQMQTNLYDTLKKLKEDHATSLEKKLQIYLSKYKEKLETNGIKMTHQRIADDLGVSRESVTRVLNH